MESQFMPPKTQATVLPRLPKPLSKSIVIAAALFALIASILLGISGAAGNASLSVSPSSGSYNKNASFTLSIYENSGSETVNAVEARLTYDQSKLQFVSVNNDGSPFGTCGEKGGGNGNVTIACAKLGGAVTGKQLVGKIAFKALAGSGSTAVNFKAGSHIVRHPDGEDIWNGNTAGGTYSFKTSSSSPSSPGSGSSSPSQPTSGQSTQPSSSGDATGSTSSNSTSAAVPPSSPSTVQPNAATATGQNPYSTTSQETSEDKKSNLLPVIALGSLIGILLVVGGYFSRFYISRMFRKDTHNLEAYRQVSKPQAEISKPNSNSVNTVAEHLHQINAPNLPSPGTKILPNPK